MKENICFKVCLRNGEEIKHNIDGVNTVLDAAFEIASSLLNGDDLGFTAEDILKIEDIPG